MINFQTLLSDFFNKYLSIQRGVSINTIKTYRDTFVELLNYLKDIKKKNPDKIKIEDIDYNTINSFLDYLEETKGISASTRNNRLAAIKSFFKYISYSEPQYLSQCTSVLSIHQKKFEQKEINYLTIAAIQYLFSLFDTKDKEQLRDLCIISLLYESGARVSELVNIRRLEIRLTSPPTLVLHGKGNKTRIVPIDSSISSLLSKYIEIYKVTNDDYLFFNSSHKKLTREGANYILQKWFKIAKDKRSDLFPDSISPHSLRHSRAMHLLENGVNLIYIRDLLGHVSVTTTEIYSKANPEIKRKYIEIATNELIGETKDFSEEKESELLNWLKTKL